MAGGIPSERTVGLHSPNAFCLIGFDTGSSSPLAVLTKVPPPWPGTPRVRTKYKFLHKLLVSGFHLVIQS